MEGSLIENKFQTIIQIIFIGKNIFFNGRNN